MNQSWDVTEQREQNVDQQIHATASFHHHTDGLQVK
jgi:hypothetical protein